MNKWVEKWLKAVSYTHLDVYKRQALHYWLLRLLTIHLSNTMQAGEWNKTGRCAIVTASDCDDHRLLVTRGGRLNIPCPTTSMPIMLGNP